MDKGFQFLRKIFQRKIGKIYTRTGKNSDLINLHVKLEKASHV